jgi:predicted acyl esterase
MASRLRRPLGTAVLVLALAPGVAHAAVNAHGSAMQVYATGLTAKAPVSLLNSAGKAIRTRKVDKLGAVLFRKVKPGSGYKVRAGSETSEALTVFSNQSAPPDEKVYEQEIASKGYQYLTTRDGTKLAINVHPPTDLTEAFQPGSGAPDSGAPTPTVIEYSGYGYASPDGAESSIGAVLNGLGFTVVDVNMRGTGCSGGAFDFFEPLQGLDGYDVIETIARQPWVANGKVGMMGISYGGISQLFTAQTQPPSLSAIAPLSVIDMTQTTLYPGGILNTGFAFNWSKERVHDAKPAGEKQGQAWAYKRIQNGDEVCKDNQAMHAEAAPLIKMVRNNSYYRPKVADPLAPVTFVDKIKVPVFMACQNTDEQTGGHCPTLAAKFTGTDRKWFTFTNGVHVDSLDPETFNRWYDFLMLYVAKQPPIVNAARAKAASPVVYQVAMGIPGITLPDDPIQHEPTYEGALAAYEKLPSIRILFDNGAGGNPGEPYPGYEHSFPSWPVPGTQTRTWFAAPKGVLADAAPKAAGADSFTWDQKARPDTNFKGDTGAGENGLWTAIPPYKWVQPPAGTAVSYMTNPLAEDTTVVGAGSVWLWVKAAKKVVDLQVTITEVRPDGKETFVQGGWLKSSFRKLDKAKSTPLDPWPSGRLKDLRNLPRGKFAQLPIPLYYQTHGYRKGSRIRVIVSAPDGDQPIWAFAEAKPGSKTKVTIGRSPKMRSRLMLPVVPKLEIPTELPPCPGLRGEPCRDAPK